MAASIGESQHERDEIGMLWSALPASMKQKCLETVQEDQWRKRMEEPQRREALAYSCRMFFQREYEEAVLRPVACSLDLIPYNEDIFRLSEADLGTRSAGATES